MQLCPRRRAGGYRLVGGYRTRFTGLARGEAEVLFLSGVPGALRDMGLEDAASAARLKVSAALLPALQGASRTAAQRFHLEPRAGSASPRRPACCPRWPMPSGRTAVSRHATAAVLTAPGGDVEASRALEPYGLVLKAGVWCLCARAVPGGFPDPGAAPGHDGAVESDDAVGAGGPADGRSPGAFRVYRIDRFSEVTPAPAWARTGDGSCGTSRSTCRGAGPSGPPRSPAPSCARQGWCG